jgi:hypothetical protein
MSTVLKQHKPLKWTQALMVALLLVDSKEQELYIKWSLYLFHWDLFALSVLFDYIPMSVPLGFASIVSQGSTVGGCMASVDSQIWKTTVPIPFGFPPILSKLLV